VAALQSVAIQEKQPQHYNFVPQAEPQIQYFQKTIVNSVSCQGIGVHSGNPVTLTLQPAVSGSGVTFVRTDLGGVEIQASWQTVVDTQSCTTIGNQRGDTVSTIEHLMAALAANGIDNIRVEIDGPELPIMDGSAHPFMVLIEKAGIKEKRTPRHVIRVLKTITVEEGDRKASLSPAPFYAIEVDFDFMGRTNLAGQSRIFCPLKDNFFKDISSARTFGYREDAEKMWAMGLAKGASLENTVVYDGDTVLNEEGLRYEDECVRHKVLDALGDLHLSGGLILGKFHGVRTGHGLHHKLLVALFSDPQAWKVDVK
jgi:UDP-3-O-[3-hydroxymyristoyl] N-acetylglucosamine deacetylase